MFDTFFVQPVFNVLVAIYALIPGHDFGFALIIFTALIRLAMWPLVKKQLHQATAMKRLQPELKKLKAKAAGDKQKESALMMELYKERGVNPFSQIGLLVVQIPLFIALYSGINKIVKHPEEILTFSYPFVRDLSWMQELVRDISRFDATLFGIIDLNRAAYSKGATDIPAIIIVLLSAVLQYFVSKQLSPSAKDARGLKSILGDAKEGKKADQSDVSAAVNRNMLLLTPFIIAFVTLGIPAALALYLLTSSVVAYFQQRYILSKDEVELEAIADGEPVEAVVELPDKPKTKDKKKATSSKRKKRR